MQSRAEQSRAEQSRAEQSRAEQSRAEQSRAEHLSVACLKDYFRTILLVKTSVAVFARSVIDKDQRVLSHRNQVVLVVFDFMADIFLTFFVRLPRVAVRSVVNSSWNCTTKLTFDPYESLIDVVCDLAIMSAGILYCPVIPLAVFVKLCLTYPLKLFHIWCQYY